VHDLYSTKVLEESGRVKFVTHVDLYFLFAHWAETDYGLSAGQHAVLPEGKGKGKTCILTYFNLDLINHKSTALNKISLL